MSHLFERQLALAWPPADWKDFRTIVAVSGGADSVALLRGLAAIRAPDQAGLFVAHYNHGWRGAEGDDDASFVADVAAQLALPCHVGKAPAGARRTEDDARTLRQSYLQQVASDVGARYLALAHTADDQAETILHRFLRGSGLRGLAGMPRARPFGCATLIRPLLAMSRSDVLAYLADQGQPHREDSTNADRRFTRNRLRRQLLPHLMARYNPRIVEALLRLGVQATEWQQALEPLVAALVERGATIRGSDLLEFDRQAFVGQPAALTLEAVRRAWRDRGWPQQAMDDRAWRELSSLLTQEPPPRKRITLPGNVDARIDGDKVLCQRLSPGNSQP